MIRSSTSSGSSVSIDLEQSDLIPLRSDDEMDPSTADTVSNTRNRSGPELVWQPEVRVQLFSGLKRYRPQVDSVTCFQQTRADLCTCSFDTFMHDDHDDA